MTTYVRRRPKSLVPRVIHGDATDLVLRDSSVDAVVTDPPYLLGFMGKQWDSRKAHEHLDWHGQWCAEALRVLKPGGYMLAFGGTRTWHRLMCAVEDAGFEVRDSIAWLYGNALEAARLEGFSSIGVENHEPYLELIQQRLSR